MMSRIWKRRRDWIESLDLLWKIFLLCMICLGSVKSDSRRPFYNIAHMVNSIDELDEFLSRGANAIELDINFYRNGSVKNVYHGYPCDCYRVCDEKEKLDKYFNYVRDISNPTHRKQLTLLLLDLKLEEVPRPNKYTAGEEIAKYIMMHLWNEDRGDPRVGVVVSIGHTSDSEAVHGVRDTFIKTNRDSQLKKLGFDVGLNDDMNAIRRMWDRLGVDDNLWQGDGITNCLRPLKEDSRLRQAVRFRDKEGAFVTKVYDWTVDLTVNIRQSLRAGVDGILTNFPERVHAVLQEKEFLNRYRIADSADNPFTKVLVKSQVRPKSRPPAVDTHVASLRETAVAMLGYMYDFFRLRLKRPATLFPFLQDIFRRATPFFQEYRATLLRLSKNGLIG